MFTRKPRTFSASRSEHDSERFCSFIYGFEKPRKSRAEMEAFTDQANVRVERLENNRYPERNLGSVGICPFQDFGNCPKSTAIRMRIRRPLGARNIL